MEMFERKLIRHPHGHEEVLIVDGAVLRAHDLPVKSPKLTLNDIVSEFSEVFLRMWEMKAERDEKIRQRILQRHRAVTVPMA